MTEQDKLEKIEKIFPEYFDRFTIPEGAKEESIKVYRACRSGKCDKLSFLPSFEEAGFMINPLADEKNPGLYSLSTYEKPTDVKRFAGVMSDMQVPFQIALGSTEPRHGVVQRTRERTKQRTSHVDWWLYKDAAPYEEFKMIDNFEEHLQNYIRERDEKNERVCKTK